MSVNFTAGLVTLFCTTPAAAFLCCFLPLVALLLAIDISHKMQRKTNDTKEKTNKIEKKIEKKKKRENPCKQSRNRNKIFELFSECEEARTTKKKKL
jgi:flagellar biosynthesis component FlhA